MVNSIRQDWTDSERAFLLGFKNGKPNWNLLPLENLFHMPAVKWKLSNIKKLIQQNPAKHAEQLKALEECVGAQ